MFCAEAVHCKCFCFQGVPKNAPVPTFVNDYSTYALIFLTRFFYVYFSHLVQSSSYRLHVFCLFAGNALP